MTMQAEVIIVGAGPAGATAAKILAEYGHKVLLLDKEKFPRDKPCGGGLPMRTVKKFPYLREKHLISSYLHGGWIYSPSLQKKVLVQKSRPLVGMVLRREFDHGLVKIAIKAGAEFKDETAVRDIVIKKDNAQVLLQDNSVLNASIIIGADGVFSSVAKATALRPPHMPIAITIFSEFCLSEKLMDKYFTPQRHGHLHFKFRGIEGYGWVFPKHHHVNVGVGEFRSRKNLYKKPQNLRKVFLLYLDYLKNQNILPSNIQPEPIRGGALPIQPLEKTYTDRVLLCGDAAGFINPLTGEGINYAISSGNIAAHVAHEAIIHNKMNAQFLAKYEHRWNKEFGKDIKLLLRMNKPNRLDYEKLIYLVSQDKKIAELIMDIGLGNISVNKCKAKVLQRFILLKLKQFFNLKYIHRNKVLSFK